MLGLGKISGFFNKDKDAVPVAPSPRNQVSTKQRMDQ